MEEALREYFELLSTANSATRSFYSKDEVDELEIDTEATHEEQPLKATKSLKH